MKTAHDPRHLQRVAVIKELFAWQFNPKTKLVNPITKEIIENLESIDQKIVQSAPTWPIAQINKIDLAILRLAVFELTAGKEVVDKPVDKLAIMKLKAPYKVVVDESIELAKQFGSETSPGFINGALGKLIKIEKIT